MWKSRSEHFSVSVAFLDVILIILTNIERKNGSGHFENLHILMNNSTLIKSILVAEYNWKKFFEHCQIYSHLLNRCRSTF